MADKKISELNSITGANTASGDLFVIVDVDANETKKITRDELTNALELTDFDNIDINGGTIDGVTIGGASAGAGTFTTLTTGSTVTLNGGTANGVLYLNGSKVATSGSALTFDGSRLTVSSTTPSIRLDDTNAGGPFGIDWYFSGAGGVTRANISLDGTTAEMQFQAGASGSPGWFQTFLLSGSEAMRLTSTGLGIGTSSPGNPLSVVKATAGDAITFTNGGASNKIGYLYTDNQYVGLMTIGGAGNNQGILFDLNNNRTLIQRIGGTTATFDSSGNLGLGVTPSAWGSTWRTLEGSFGQSWYYSNTATLTGLSGNAYHNGTNWIYKTTNGAQRYELGSGNDHRWYTAPSGTAGNAITFTQAMTLDASGNLGLGNTSPSTFGKVRIDVAGTTTPTNATNVGPSSINLYAATNGGSTDSTVGIFGWQASQPGLGSGIGFSRENTGNWGTQIRFYTHPTATSNVSDITERMRLDASGNLLVGKTAASLTGEGVVLRPTSSSLFTRDAGLVMGLNRTTSDGSILEFYKDGTIVGSIASQSGPILAYLGSSYATTGAGDVGLFFSPDNDHILPVTATTSATRDDAIDLGSAVGRFDDVYATNALIQTSDANEKQDIEALSEAEQRVAVAAKALLRKFRWKSKVAEKGDDARIHFGIIAQDLQAAFETEGLDAGRYAMFIHSTWTDEETGEERSRMGVRYSELLAFIIAAI